MDSANIKCGRVYSVLNELRVEPFKVKYLPSTFKCIKYTMMRVCTDADYRALTEGVLSIFLCLELRQKKIRLDHARTANACIVLRARTTRSQALLSATEP